MQCRKIPPQHKHTVIKLACHFKGIRQRKVPRRNILRIKHWLVRVNGISSFWWLFEPFFDVSPLGCILLWIQTEHSCCPLRRSKLQTFQDDVQLETHVFVDNCVREKGCLLSLISIMSKKIESHVDMGSGLGWFSQLRFTTCEILSLGSYLWVNH